MNSFDFAGVEEMSAYSDYLAMQEFQAWQEAAEQQEFCDWIETVSPSKEELDKWADEMMGA